MPVFSYRGISESGEKKEGVIEAASERSAFLKLRASGIFPFEIRETKERFKFKAPRFFRGFSDSELSIQFRSVGLLLDSGVPISESLNSVLNDVENRNLKILLSKMLDGIKSGSSFASSLREAGIKDELITSIIEAGERSGLLSKSLFNVADILERRERFRSTLIGVLIYPAVIFIVSVFVVGFMVSVVVPKISRIYVNMKASLPFATRVVLWISNLFIKHGVLLVLFLLLLPLVLLFTSRRYRMASDRLRLKIPVFGNFILKVSLQRFFETLSTLIRSGIPATEALKISKKTLKNVYLESIIDSVIGDVERGEGIGRSFENHGKPYFPNISIQMIKAGENSGKLEEAFLKLSRVLEEEISRFSSNLTSILEPVTIIFIGGIIGFIIFALLLPIVQISTLR